MGLFDFLMDNYSRDALDYKKELRADIRECKSDIKDIMSDAKDLQDDIKELKSDARRLGSDVGSKMKRHNEYKVDMLKKLNTDIASDLHAFQDFHIDSKIVLPKKPSGFNALSSGSISMPNFSSAVNVVMSPGGGIGIPSLFHVSFRSTSDLQRELDDVQNVKYKAQEYKWDLESARDDYENLIARLRDVGRYIDEERNLLDDLFSKMATILEQLTAAMRRSQFTQEEADCLKGVYHIGEMMITSLNTRLVDDNISMNGSYRKYMDNLKKINSAIPRAPRLETSSSWVNVVLYTNM